MFHLIVNIKMFNEEDLDRKFQEDLERAQALSLESLALEQFKNRKRLEKVELNSNDASVKATRSVSVSRSSSINETDCNKVIEYHKIKSRPRPGTSMNTHLNSKIVLPPPVRKNSTTESTCVEPDLISFTSPCKEDLNFFETSDSLSTNQSRPPGAELPINVLSGLIAPQWQTSQSSSGFREPPLFHHTPPSWHRTVSHGPAYPYMYPPPEYNRPPVSPVPMPGFNFLSLYNTNASSVEMPPPLPPKNQVIPPPLPATKPPHYTQKTNEGNKSYYICDNLIDFANSESSDKNSVRVSILEDFDPLTKSYDSSKFSSITASEASGDDTESLYASVYDEYDPYDFINSSSGKNSTSDPLYAAVLKSEAVLPLSPSPPLNSRIHYSTIGHSALGKPDTIPCLYENITVKKNAVIDFDLIAFHKMVRHLREQFHFDDPDTNMGLVVSPMMHRQYRDGTSIKVVIHPQYESADFTQPVSFTCNVTCSIEHITQHVVCELDAPLEDQYTLKVWGYNEYLVPTTLLSDYEYVHNCLKLEEDVLLILVPDRLVDRSLARTIQDDKRDKEIKLEDLITNDTSSLINNEQLKILLETLESEIQKLEVSIGECEVSEGNMYITPAQLSGVIQSIKLISNIMGNLETVEVSQALDDLKNINQNFIYKLVHSSSSNGLSELLSEMARAILDRLKLGVQDLIEMYCQSVGIAIEINNKVEPPLSSSKLSELNESLLIRICSVHRPSLDWKYDNYLVAGQVYHGTRPIGHPLLTQPNEISQSLYPRILFNCWLDLEDVLLSSLSREARLVLVVYGRKLQSADDSDSSNTPQYKQEELGWAAVQLFNYKGIMSQGGMFLSIWPKECNYIYGPAPSPGSQPFPDHAILAIEIAAPKVVFPPASQFADAARDTIMKGNFNSLDLQTQEQLVEISQQDMLCKLLPEIREVLWEKRHYLYKIPEALPKVLLAAHSWAPTCLADLYGMLYSWKPLPPVQAIQLLLPTFPDIEVRKIAVKWLHGIRNDELVDYLPQLVVALRHETYENNALAHFLLDRSLRSPRIAHHLFWLLSHNLPGTMPQNGNLTVDLDNISEVRYYRRMLLLLRSLLAICGESLRRSFISQQILVKELNEAAERVQKTKESHRLVILNNSMEGIQQYLQDNPTSLPLSPTLRVAGINVESCSYFPSNTLPLKINFIASDGSTVPAIYKVGDDLQQDQLTLQMVRIMDKMWLKEGLDLKMVSFCCVPTGKKKGMIELVTNAETLRKIQVEHGLTGSFKDKPIAEWLAKHNPSELEYARAVENFTASCAGYCVVTYILGVCDRHNDNIMLKTSGHLFHIDFGKFLGDAQMFGNFKRDRAPFVLTTDMAYVINCGDRPSEKFHRFVDLCCQAFNIVRNNGNFFLHLFTLMASSGIRGVTTEAVSHLRRSLLLEQTNPEAAAYFARLIESSLKSWFTQVNFFLHNLAQLKFSGAHNEDQLLSFVPKTYSVATDGRLTHVAVVGFQKRYDPEKRYIYILRVKRENQVGHMDLFRTYKEFCELYQKLCLHFPLAKLHSLSTGLHMGRSNIKQVAAKRFTDVSLFVQSLFKTADEIAHSDLVYTFFHPLLRDQQAPEYYSRKAKDRAMDEKTEIGRLRGQLKLSICFNKGVFTVMVHHARCLPILSNGQEPSTYVKVYLQPDPTKSTKRKTKVVKRNCHPSFMEMLEYRMSLDVVSHRILKATVWNHDPLQENEFLGGVELDLSEVDLTIETTEWYSLTNLSR